MSYTDKGELELVGADDANVPVNCFLHEPDDASSKWRWTADNFMPRRSRVADGQYSIEADSREAIIEAVQKYVTPLYEAALFNLRSFGECYYWTKLEETRK